MIQSFFLGPLCIAGHGKFRLYQLCQMVASRPAASFFPGGNRQHGDVEPRQLPSLFGVVVSFSRPSIIASWVSSNHQANLKKSSMSALSGQLVRPFVAVLRICHRFQYVLNRAVVLLRKKNWLGLNHPLAGSFSKHGRGTIRQRRQAGNIRPGPESDSSWADSISIEPLRKHETPNFLAPCLIARAGNPSHNGVC